jgi:hypothetical protein
VPAPSVTVPANNTSTTFTATAGSMASNQSATLTASLNGASRTATINLVAPQPLTLSSLTCNPTNLNAGAITTCTVALSGAAPNGGTVVNMARITTCCRCQLLRLRCRRITPPPRSPLRQVVWPPIKARL